MKAKGTRRDRAIWDKAVNDQWSGLRPVLSGAESLVAARKLYRHAMGKAWKGKWALTSGRRASRPIGATFYVNPDEAPARGLRELIHSISHVCHRRLHPADAPHSIRQAQLEARLTRFAVSRNWHEGALAKPEKPAQPEAPKPTLKERREAIRAAALARAEHRLKLAQAAVDRLRAKPKRRKAPVKRRPVKRPQYMAQAKRMAAAHGITIEAEDMGSGRGWWVHGPETVYGDGGDEPGLRPDPCEGTHFCGSPEETADTVREYVNDLMEHAKCP